MTSIPAAPLRRQRLRTSIALAVAAGAIAAAAMMSPRGPRRVTAPAGGGSSGSSLLSASLVSSHILPGEHETFLAISLAAPAGAIARRGPASVAIVLDRSTSMKGVPFEQARAAAIELVDRLGPDDELTLVSYSTEARIDVPLTIADEGGRARARAALRNMEARGSTNISAALMLGADELRGAARPVKRVVLISDGRPFDGIADPAGLIALAADRAAQGVSITTVGVSLEYNEEIMAGIAIAGRGRYYFVENTLDLSKMFGEELDSLGQTAIVGGTLTVTPKPGVTITGVLGYSWKDGGGGAVVVPVADLRQGERTKVVLRVVANVDAGTASVALADVRWTFREVTGADRTLTASASATVTRDASVVEANRDRDTQRLIEQARTAQAIEEASAAYASGQVERVHAILQDRAQDARRAARSMGDADLERQIQNATSAAEAGFAAPPAAIEGQRALKGNRADAYKLSR